MEASKKRVIAGAGLLIAGLTAFLVRRRPQIPPEPPPDENYGRARGYVLDAETNAKIMNAEIYVDGAFQRYSDNEGTYYTNYFLFGPHTITVKANNYETTDFHIELNETLMRVDLALPPLPEAPTEWTEGVEVTKIEAIPATLYLGQIVHIGVSIKYPYPLPLPADIHGSVLIDGIKLSTDVTIDFRNPTLSFQYTPTAIGEYLVRAQDKSASFMVLEDIPAHYFWPGGGRRVPLCTDILIPDVDPFTLPYPPYTHPGGDLKYSDVLGHRISYFWIPLQFPHEVKEKLPYATPIEWTPSEAVINDWVSNFYRDSLTIMAVDYDCPEYWNSKDELAQMIVAIIGGKSSFRIPDEWILQYGKTCPTCNGTGIETNHRTRRCSECGGSGKSLRVKLGIGLADWVKPIKYYSVCGGGTCTPRLLCPYCDKYIDGPDHIQGGSWDMLSFARKFLTHIETAHPNHPLTEPAWF